MIDTLLEGVRASVQPCSLALVLPGLGATLIGCRRGFSVAGGYVLAAGVLAWAQASLLIDAGATWPVGVGLAVVAGLGAWLLVGRPGGQRLGWGVAGTTAWVGHMQSAGAGVLVGSAAGLLWRPCVGPQLGTILSATPDEPVANLLPLLVYVTGLLAATAVVAAVAVVAPDASSRVTRVRTAFGLAPIGVLVAVLASGRYEQIIGALVRASGLT